MGLLGILVASSLLALLPKEPVLTPIHHEFKCTRESRGGFGVLLSIGVLDTATRMGYLLFLPFLIHARGGSSATIGLGLALVFIGGALGKASCGWLGQYVGVLWSVVVTEIATAALIVVTCFTPITAMLLCLPLLGIVLNGTSSVLYGTVPELAPEGEYSPSVRVVLYRSHRFRRSRPNRLRGNRRPFQPNDRRSFVGGHGGGHRAAGFKPPCGFLEFGRR
jgi:FSR family fosmidomycin resistance protein-like MFS transporter